ncbi:MAG TPA: ParA family protein [Anaerolineae bacterium]|nr:ParA family protein [Anaerolineae bacterium]
MTKVIAIAMQKGGVGKTTTTINLAAALNRKKKKVLVVDLDAQGNLSEHAGFDPETTSPTIYDLFKDEIDGVESAVTTAIYETDEGFHILPSQPELSLIELSLANALSRERILATILDPILSYYDYILIDCNPSLGLLVINALTMADSVLIPVQAEFLAARGANMILATIERIKRRKLNPFLEVEGVLLTMADQRTLLTRDVISAIHAQLSAEHRIFKTIINRSVRFAESAAAGQSLIAYSPRSKGAKAYLALAEEVESNG